MNKIVLALLLNSLAGCDDGGVHIARDLGSNESPDLLPSTINAAATSGDVTLIGSDITIAGSGSSVVGGISLTHGAGTVELDGKTVPAAVYERQPFGSEILYQTMAVEKDRVWILWVYCSTMSSTVDTVFYEATDGTKVTDEAASGTCTDTLATTQVPVNFPAVSLPMPPLLPGFTIDGANIQLSGAAPGSVTFGTTTFMLLVFNTVDCTTGCGTPGWTELHSLLWDPVQGQFCFAIIYLISNDTSHVEVEYSLTLPTLTEPAGNTQLPANWTIP